MTWRRDKLPELVRAMSGRPRHEALRDHVTELLREGFGAPYDEIAHELCLLDNRGRARWADLNVDPKGPCPSPLPRRKLCSRPGYLSPNKEIKLD